MIEAIFFIVIFWFNFPFPTEYIPGPTILPDTGLRNLIETVLKKLSGMWILFLYITFIIKCEWIKLVECGGLLTIYGKSGIKLLSWDEQKWQNMTLKSGRMEWVFSELSAKITKYR